MVPLFKSVGYQLIYHTFSEKCEYIKFKFRLRPSTFFFWRQLESQKKPQHPPPSRRCRFPAYKHVLAP